MLRHSLQLENEAAQLEAAISRVLTNGPRTADLGGSASTRDVGDAVLAELAL